MAARTEHDLNFASPSLSWDEGLPLGNGILGALVRGDGDPLRISIDRTDLWGLRTVPEFQDEEYTFATIRRWEAEVRIEDLKRVYEAPYNRAGPTKLPFGRIELRFSEEKGFRSSSLSLEEANAEVTQGGGILISIYLHAETPVGCISVSGLDSTPPRGVLPPPLPWKGKGPKGACSRFRTRFGPGISSA